MPSDHVRKIVLLANCIRVNCARCAVALNLSKEFNEFVCIDLKCFEGEGERGILVLSFLRYELLLSCGIYYSHYVIFGHLST